MIMKVMWQEDFGYRDTREYQMGATIVGIQIHGRRPEHIQLTAKDLRQLANQIKDNPLRTEQYVHHLANALKHE